MCAMPWIVSVILLYHANTIIAFFERVWNRKTCEHRWDRVQRTARLSNVRIDSTRIGFRKDVVFSSMCVRCGKLKRWKAGRDG